jgi:hypothetical protein
VRTDQCKELPYFSSFMVELCVNYTHRILKSRPPLLLYYTLLLFLNLKDIKTLWARRDSGYIIYQRTKANFSINYAMVLHNCNANINNLNAIFLHSLKSFITLAFSKYKTKLCNGSAQLILNILA